MSDIFNPETDLGERNREWVTLSGGKRLCVWELTAHDSLRIAERCLLPEGMPGGVRYSRTEWSIWRIMHSCYNGDTPEAKPIFNEDNVLQIYRLRDRDSALILEAIARVNGTDDASVEAVEDFGPVPVDGATGTCSSSASSSFTDCPPNSDTSAPAS